MTRIHLAGVLMVIVAAFMMQQHTLAPDAPDHNIAAQQAAQPAAVTAAPFILPGGNNATFYF